MVAHGSQAGDASAQSRPASPSAAPPASPAPSDEKAAIINELRGEISTLRRELRLLRIANAELERVAVRDTLTPLFNRRYFLTALNERLVRAQRYNTRSAVLFIDVNMMKRINDAFGHSAGDYALIHIAHLVQANIRATDVAARIGGDEFAIILEEVDEQRAMAKADQLADVMNATPCLFGDRPLPVSASIGLTMLRPHDTEDALIERADADMYARKRAWHKDAAASPPAPSTAPRNAA